MNAAYRSHHQQPISEALVPLSPLLRQIVWERKHLAERLFLQAQQRAEEGGIPASYEYPDTVSSLAQKREGVWELVRRDLTFRFTLWTKRTWIMNHRDRYSESMMRDAKHGYHSFSPERDWYFVQFHGLADDLLWFGDLVEAQLVRHLERSSQDDQASIEHLHLARELGYTYGCSAKPSGLLNPRSPWLTEHTREGDLILEPESLYRGILYGAALSLLALTNGGSVGELLQISVDRDVVDAGERHQLLLPDGAKSERQPFRITEEASQLLQEIERGLVQTYGEVPLIHPTSQSRYDRLHAERYLFQWQRHLLDRSDVQTLVRFVLHQLPLPGVEGSPLHVTLDMLRDGRTPPEEAATTKERSLVLSDAFGFTQDVVEGLSSASRDTYCRDFFAYYQFAGSKETALQVQTLQRWMDHLVEANYKIGTVNRMADEVRSILHTAAAQGLIDQEVATAVQSIKPIHREKTVESRG